MKQFKGFGNIILLVLAIYWAPGLLKSQTYYHSSSISSANTITPTDSALMVNLPEISPKQTYKSELPAWVDNSTQPYFRPYLEQVNVECGQYAAIAYNFTYEINRAHNTAANFPENQFPTHYTFNFMNGGQGWHGVSYIHSLEIARTNGHPNAADYGTINQGGPAWWMTGYDKYYNGMSNKVDEIYQIRIDTPEGLETLKHWLHNHLAGDEVGGLACFYSSNPWNVTQLPAGTPEGGKHVITHLPGPAAHSNAICGYNDSIRFDYNNDGLYTNDIDITGDGIVDMRDWEIGGLKFIDGYNGGINYADSGFCYLMYKALLPDEYSNGFWNQAVHVITVKENYEPLLTYKITLSHNCREQIKVFAGVSADVSAISPDYTLGFPLFNYQGGCMKMQGGDDPGDEVIEFGLDVTPLLGRINSGEPAKFFLMVDEKDPNGWGIGELVSFSVMDYTGSATEIPLPAQNLPLVNNDLTTVAVTASLDFNSPQILTDQLPVAVTGEPFTYAIDASGGTPPYEWSLVKHYETEIEQIPYPSPGVIQLNFPDTVKSQVMQKIEFEFPFYGDTFDTVYVHTDGFIMFDDQPYPWPYMYDPELMLKKTKNISPFLNYWMKLTTGDDYGVWYEGDETQATFLWKMTTANNNPPEVNFAVTLFPSGDIEFLFGDESLPNKPWMAGISYGDQISYNLVKSMIISEGEIQSIRLIPVVYPAGLNISDDGVLTCLPEADHKGTPIEVCLSDHENLDVRKTYQFYSNPAGVSDQINKTGFSIMTYPNPASKMVSIRMQLQYEKNISFKLVDLSGRTLVAKEPEKFAAGEHRLIWNLEDLGVKSGIYYLAAQQDNAMTRVVAKVVIMDR